MTIIKMAQLVRVRVVSVSGNNNHEVLRPKAVLSQWRAVLKEVMVFLRMIMWAMMLIAIMNMIAVMMLVGDHEREDSAMPRVMNVSAVTSSSSKSKSAGFSQAQSPTMSNDYAVGRSKRDVPRGSVAVAGTTVAGVSSLKDWTKPSLDASVASTATNKSLLSKRNKGSGLLGFKKKTKKWQELESDDDCDYDTPLRPIPIGTITLPEDDIVYGADANSGIDGVKTLSTKDDMDDFVEELENSTPVVVKEAAISKGANSSGTKLSMERELEMLAPAPSDESALRIYAADDCSLSTYYTSNTLNLLHRSGALQGVSVI